MLHISVRHLKNIENQLGSDSKGGGAVESYRINNHRAINGTGHGVPILRIFC